MSLNTITLSGHLGKDPVTETTRNGTVYVRLRLAVNRYYQSNGETIESTEWFNLECWGNTALVAQKFLKKGSKIAITGQLRCSAWNDEEGNYYERVYVVVSSLDLPPKPKNGDTGTHTKAKAKSSKVQGKVTHEEVHF